MTDLETPGGRAVAGLLAFSVIEEEFKGVDSGLNRIGQRQGGGGRLGLCGVGMGMGMEMGVTRLKVQFALALALPWVAFRWPSMWLTSHNSYFEYNSF